MPLDKALRTIFPPQSEKIKVFVKNIASVKRQIFILSVLLFVSVIASGCVDQNSSNLEKITETPEEYVGEEVTLRGQIQIKKDESVISQKAAESTVDSDTIRAKNAERKIGNLDGELPIVGECYQSDYASEVKVKGEIKSYETCNCEVEQEYVRKDNKPRYIVIHEDLGITETYNQGKVINWSSGNEIQRLSKSDLTSIDESIGTNLSEHLELEMFSKNQNFSNKHFRKNGTWVNPDRVTEGIQSIRTEEFKYTIGENAVIIQEEVEKIQDSKAADRKALTRVCKEVSKVRENHHSDTLTRTSFNGCKSPAEKQYYFSCTEVVDQYE